jgi:hypothetical protein
MIGRRYPTRRSNVATIMVMAYSSRHCFELVATDTVAAVTVLMLGMVQAWVGHFVSSITLP